VHCCLLPPQRRRPLASSEFGGNFFVQIVFLVLGFPVAGGDAEVVDQCAINDVAVAVLLGQLGCLWSLRSRWHGAMSRSRAEGLGDAVRAEN
jgi:hypothetical protein